jgi:preprotein translocase subunit SecF
MVDDVVAKSPGQSEVVMLGCRLQATILFTDTIVVFDRIRQNVVRHAGEPFADVVNHSLVQTLGRSVNTSVTTLLTLVALYLFGGTTIQTFVLTLLIGVTLGTYRSIFNASLLLFSWEHGEIRHFWRRVTGRSIAPASAG